MEKSKGYDLTLVNANGTPYLNRFVDRFSEKNFDNAYEIEVSGNKISSHRYRSWEFCRKAFLDARNVTLDKTAESTLALQLAFYLASWGMYRGSSFLLSLDYTVHKEIVKIVMKDCYRELFDSDKLLFDEDGRKTYLNLLFGNKMSGENKIEGVVCEMRKWYKAWHIKVLESPVGGMEENNDEEEKTDISSVLITKVLMGVYGCIPAYDRYVMDGLKTQGINASFGRSAVKELLEYTIENKGVSSNIEKVWKSIKEKSQCTDLEPRNYTFMKVVDMLFWEIGAGYVVNVIKNTKRFCEEDVGIIKSLEEKIMVFEKAAGPFTCDVGGLKFESDNMGSLIMCIYEEFKDDIKKHNGLRPEYIKNHIKEKLEPEWLATTRYSKKLVKAKKQ